MVFKSSGRAPRETKSTGIQGRQPLQCSSMTFNKLAFKLSGTSQPQAASSLDKNSATSEASETDSCWEVKAYQSRKNVKT